jgi:aminopeptidase N
MQTFVDQPGIPLITIENTPCGPGARDGGKPRVTIEVAQQRYVRDPAAAKPARQQLWEIPVCLRTSSGFSQCDIVNEPRTAREVPACPDWVMGNAGARGYYRTAVPPAALRRVAADIAELSPAERMVVLSDESALVRASRHDAGAMMDLASGFSAERNGDVIGTLSSILTGIDEDLVTAATRAPFRAWVAALLSPALADVGVTARSGDTDQSRAMRATLLAALGRTARRQDVLAAARDMVGEELKKRGSVEPTLLAVAVDLAAIEGDANLYDQYLAHSKAAVDPEERYRYLYGLTSFADPTLVRRTMELAISPEVRSQDAKIVIAQLLANADTRELAWDLLQQRWPEIQKKTGEFVGNTVIVGALGSFCNAGTADEIQKFFTANKVPDAERTLQQSIEGVRSCARFATAQRPKLAAWLAAH